MFYSPHKHPLSVCGPTETGGAFSYKPTGADSPGVPSAGCLGDGPLPSREQGHATLPPAGEAGLASGVTLALKQVKLSSRRSIMTRWNKSRLSPRVAPPPDAGGGARATVCDRVAGTATLIQWGRWPFPFDIIIIVDIFKKKKRNKVSKYLVVLFVSWMTSLHEGWDHSETVGWCLWPGMYVCMYVCMCVFVSVWYSGVYPALNSMLETFNQHINGALLLVLGCLLILYFSLYR